jgi:hypothetical protein
LTWRLPQEAEPLITNLPQEKQKQVVDVFQNSLGIVALFLLKSMGNQKLAHHLESQMNVMADLLTLAEAQGQQQQ